MLKKQELISLCVHSQHVRPRHSVYTNLVFLSFCSTVSDLQEEGKNAINSPMSPALADVHPEDTQLGTGHSSAPCPETVELLWH